MALSHRLQRLEKRAPPPPRPCEYCGIAFLKDGSGPVYPGIVLPADIDDDTGAQLLGCKSCCAWVRVERLPQPNPDGAYHVTSAQPCGWPEYI